MDLLTIRFLKRLTQIELQAKSGVLQSRISMAENGYITLRQDEREKIEKVLNMKGTIDWEGSIKNKKIRKNIKTKTCV